jgi:hypothetical protein
VLDLNGLSDAPGRAGGEIVEVDVSVEFRDGVPAVVRTLTRRKTISARIDLPEGHSFGLGTGDSANAELFGRLAPVGARLEPGEVDPPAVGTPTDVVGLSAVKLWPTHDVLDGEVERLGSLRRDRGRGSQGEREACCARHRECVAE